MEFHPIRGIGELNARLPELTGFVLHHPYIALTALSFFVFGGVKNTVEAGVTNFSHNEGIDIPEPNNLRSLIMGTTFLNALGIGLLFIPILYSVGKYHWWQIIAVVVISALWCQLDIYEAAYRKHVGFFRKKYYETDGAKAKSERKLDEALAQVRDLQEELRLKTSNVTNLHRTDKVISTDHRPQA